MADIFLSGVLYMVLLTPVALALGRRRPAMIACGVVWFLVIVALAMANYKFGWIEQKFASSFAYERYLGISRELNKNFLIQGILSAPAFMVTDAWEAAIGVNVAIFAVLVMMCDKLRWPYILIFLAPAVVHIAIFALRDVVLAVTIMIGCQTMLVGEKPRLLASLPVVLLLYMQRPEVIVIFAGALGLIYFREFRQIYKVLVIFVTVLVAVFILPRAPVLLGLPPASSILTLPDVLLRFFEARADRWVDTDGANTAMMGGAISAVPFLLRFPLQFFAFFLSPLPMDFKGAISMVFLLDSLFFIAVFVMFWRVADRRHKVFLMVYIVANALFVANYGNLFRLRMPCYLIMLSGFFAYHEAKRRVMDALPARPAAPEGPATPSPA